MLSDRDIQAIVRILSHCDELERDMESVGSLEHLREHAMMCRSMAMLLIWIGVVVEDEVSTKLRNAYPDIPWKELESVRDTISARYTRPNPEAVWRFATEIMPPVKVRLSEILDGEMKS